MSAPLKLKLLCKNQSGMTLLEIMMALPLGIIVMIAAFFSLQYLTDSYQNMKAKSQSIMMQDELRKFVMTPAECSGRLQTATRTYDAGLASTGDLQLSFALSDGTSIVKSGAVLDKYNLFVHSLTYKVVPGGVNYMADPLLPGNMFQYGVVNIAASKNSPQNQSFSAPEILSGLVLSVDEANNISRCFVVDDSFDFCTSIGGHLYFDGVKMNCFSANPCGNKIWSGVDATNSPICKNMNTIMSEACPADQFLVSSGAGSATCRILGAATSSTASIIPPAAAATPAPTPPVPMDCFSPGLPATSGSPSALAVIGIGGIGPGPSATTGCFYTSLGVHALVDLDFATGNLVITPGPVPNPLFPLSSFVVVSNPDGSKGVTAPSGAYLGGPIYP